MFIDFINRIIQKNHRDIDKLKKRSISIVYTINLILIVVLAGWTVLHLILKTTAFLWLNNFVLIGLLGLFIASAYFKLSFEWSRFFLFMLAFAICGGSAIIAGSELGTSLNLLMIPLGLILIFSDKEKKVFMSYLALTGLFYLIILVCNFKYGRIGEIPIESAGMLEKFLVITTMFVALCFGYFFWNQNAHYQSLINEAFKARRKLEYQEVERIKSEKKLLEEKNELINLAKQKAEESEKIKQQFLANMSHEIRTPMNAIKGMTDILLRRDPQSEQLVYLNAIKESSASLLVIINDILDISKMEAGKVELENIPFSPTELIENVKMIMQFKAEEKGLLLKTEIFENLPFRIMGDPTRLHQVLINLVGNAIKFTEKGIVKIAVSTEKLHSEKNTRFKFTISDTGVGIGEDRLEKIFESFEQAYSDTTRKFGGTGLGLAISKKLVELQNGLIWAESEKGKGSDFHFIIPYGIASINEILEETIGEEVIENVAERLKGIRILLVEDNAFNAVVAQEELEDTIENVAIIHAENGEDAVEHITRGEFDVVLMDVQMPIMNGYDATRNIRQLGNEKSKTPIIAMTANVLKEEVERCYEAGMDDFIGKPFDTEKLIEKIHELQKK